MEGTEAGWPGKSCPKCAYVRSGKEANPAWQCPGCGIAYAKYRPGAAAGLIAESREMAAEARGDRSVLALIAANLLAIVIARATGMSLQQLMAVYWVQSVIIGISFYIRMRSLKRFSTDGFSANGQPVPTTESGRNRTAAFFAVHYGFFHAGYLVFLLVDRKDGGVGSLAGLALCALVFALNHGYSLKHNIRRDALGTPNLGTLMFLPYARIVPMHLLIILGGTMAATPAKFWLFIGLKVAADVLMHTVEHHVLGKAKA